jgi:hypothetical protein
MATVWLAQDLVSQTPVALKVLFPHLRRDEQVAARFRQEMAAVRRVNHRNIVNVFDVVETPEVLSLVLEYHPGSDLKRVLRRDGPLPVDKIRDLAVQVLEGLEAAHEHGVVHRDIKPHNILVNDEGLAKVTDFGIARVDDVVGATRRTMALGTPEYLPPEVLASPLVDGRADIYSLGVTLYELATGQVPFRADSPMALMKLHQDAVVPNPRLLRPDLPGWLANVIQRAMAKEPDDRFATARQFADAIREGKARRQVAASKEDRCKRCDAALVRGVPACVDCGREILTIGTVERGGWRVMLLRKRWLPRRNQVVGDELTFSEKQFLVDTVRALGGQFLETGRLDARLRDLPVVVADHVSEQGARDLSGVLGGAGLKVLVGGGVTGGILYAGNLGCYFQAVGRAVKTAVIAIASMLAAQLAGASVLAAYLAPAWVLLPPAVLVGSVALSLERRRNALARFAGEAAPRLTSEELTRQIVNTIRGIKSPRLRSMVKRLVATGLHVRERSGAHRVEELARESDQVIRALLANAKATASLEQQVLDVDEEALRDELGGIEHDLAAASSTNEVEALVTHKTAVLARLAEHDGNQQDLVQHYAWLLDASTRLGELQAQVDEVNAAETGGAAALGHALHAIRDELDAHEALDRGHSS